MSSGSQGLSLIQQAKMMTAIKKSRDSDRVEPIFMIDIKIPKLIYKGQIKHCDRYPGANWMYLKEEEIMTELTVEQKKKIDDWLDEKDELIWKRGYNTTLVKFARATKVEPKDRDEQRLFIDNGDILIAKQTKRISALSINAIAMRLKLPYGRVEYYANKKRFVGE